jgi:hypothetical protein
MRTTTVAKEEGIGLREVLDRVTMQVLVRDHFTMIAAAVQGDVDGIPKGSHDGLPKQVNDTRLRLVYLVAQGDGRVSLASESEADSPR